MIQLANGWVQWDHDLKTYRGRVNGVIYGVRGGQFLRPTAWAAAAGVTLTAGQRNALEQERDEITLEDQRQSVMVLTRAEFLRLIPAAELVAILQAVDAPNYTVKMWMYRFEQQELIPRTAPATIAMVNALLAEGVISQATATKILDGE